MKALRDLALAICGLALGVIARLLPRSPRIWVFGAPANSFGENSKHLFLYASAQHPEIYTAWLSGDAHLVKRLNRLGLRAHLRRSCSGLWIAARAGYHFYSGYTSDTNEFLTHGAVLVSLWHGIPLKKIEFDIEQGPLRAVFREPTGWQRHIAQAYLFRRPNYLLSTSPWVSRELFSSAFRLKTDQCLDLGYPRDDILGANESAVIEHIRRYSTQAAIDIANELRCREGGFCLYLPTWRDHDPDFMTHIAAHLHVVNAALAQRDVLLLMKLHINTPPLAMTSIAGLSHLRILPSAEDVYPWLRLAARLITDYSSVAFDYLLLARPLVIFAPDETAYVSNSRSFYPSMRILELGPRVSDGAALADVLFDDTAQQAFAPSRQRARDMLFTHPAGGAAHRICEWARSIARSR